MTTQAMPRTTMTPEASRTAAQAMQEELAELLDLTLKAKHAHWNVYGPHFRSVHLQLDDITADLRNWSDLVAERIVAMGAPALGQDDALSRSGLDALPNAPIPTTNAVADIADLLTASATRARERATKLGDVDLVSQNILIEIIQGSEKHIWMLRAQLEG